MMNVQFSKAEETLLNLGGKYNMGISPRKCIKQIIYETENAIRQVNFNQQDAIRYLATKNLQHILSKQTTQTTDHKHEIQITKHIKQKLQHNKESVIEADKGKTLVIIYKQDLDEKVNNFIMDNEINEFKIDPTQRIPKLTQNTIKECKHIIDPIKRKYLIQMNPQEPNLKAKIKIHKPTTPIKLVINNTYAPTHKVAQYIHYKLKELVQLKYEYNIINTIQFADSLTKLKLNPDHKLLTVDIEDLYVKIPINFTLNIVNKRLINKRIDTGIRKELMLTLRMITNQNYFQYEGKFYKPNLGVAMGSPLSGLLAEIFLQDLEQQ
jgi:hypothetical protein